MHKFFSFLTAFLLLTGGVSAQRVGVVMSGGGAKGLYHIGVLQALEENGIPIDYVAGTSMGSIIAGMYAAGYSPAQMREIVASGVVREWVSGNIDPSCVPYYRRNVSSPSFFSIRLRLRETHDEGPVGRFRLPSSLISSTRIDLALTELFTPASTAASGDFRQLMVPFLCVASDLNSRRPVVLRSGDLGMAIRSSMSIPLAFEPVRIDSMLLYDGGIYDNFPWKPLDETFSPDFLIGSQCTAGNKSIDQSSSLINQAFGLAMTITDYDLPSDRSLTIARAVEANMLDFSDPEAIIEAGYQDALAQIPALRERIGRTVSAAQIEERRASFLAKCPPLVLDRYQVDGLNKGQTAYVRNLLHLDRTSNQERTMSFDHFRNNYFSVMGVGGEFTGEYPLLHYDSLRRRYDVGLKMSARTNSRVSIGGNISSTAFNQAFIGFEYHRIRRVSQRFSVGVYVGPIYAMGFAEGRTHFFYLKKPFVLNYSINFAVKGFRHGYFGNLTKIDNVRQMKSSEGDISLGIGMPLGHNGLLSLQTNAAMTDYNYYHTLRANIENETDRTRLLYSATKLEIIRSTLDKPFYPRRGSELSFSTIFVGARERYKPFGERHTDPAYHHWFGARARGSKYWDVPSVKWFSIGVDGEAVWSSHPQLGNPTATRMSMPSYQPIAHSQMSYMPDLHARSYLAGGVMPTFDLFPNFFLRMSFYAMWRDQKPHKPTGGPSMQYIGDLSLVYHTPIGPVSLSLTKYGIGNWRNMYLTFNFGYAIFAPSGKFY